jgi:hypothetical protein
MAPLRRRVSVAVGLAELTSPLVTACAPGGRGRGVGWDPFGFAVGTLSGDPPAGSQQSMMWAAGEGQVVDIGGGAGGVVGDVVDFAVIPGHGASGR